MVYGAREASDEAAGINREGLPYGESPEVTLLHKGCSWPVSHLSCLGLEASLPEEVLSQLKELKSMTHGIHCPSVTCRSFSAVYLGPCKLTKKTQEGCELQFAPSQLGLDVTFHRKAPLV